MRSPRMTHPQSLPPHPHPPPPTATPEPTPAPTPTPAPEPDVNLIAFVGLDDSIYTIRPDGTDQQLVSIPMSGETASLAGSASFASHTVYNWPTWSPDASKLAFTSFSDNGDFGGALWFVDIPGGLPDKVFQDPDDTIGRFVAQRSPTLHLLGPRQRQGRLPRPHPHLPGPLHDRDQ